MIRETLIELMLISGLSGYETRVAAAIAAHLDRMGLPHLSERLGNLTELSRIADLNVTFLDVSAFSQGAGHFTVAQSPALISLLAGIGDIDAALEADRVGRVGLLPGVVLTVQSATKVVLSPVTAISEELNQ